MKKHLLLSILLGITTICHSQIDLSNYNKTQFIGTAIDFFEDKTNAYTIADIQHGVPFTKGKVPVPNFFLTSSTMWVRIALLPNTSPDKFMLDVQAPLLDVCNMYTQDSSGKFVIETGGDNLPYANRKYDFVNFLFAIDNKTNAIKYYYLQTTNHEQFNLPIKLGKAAKVIKANNQDYVLAVIFMTILVVMFLYNLFIYITVKDKTYLLYVAYLFFVALTQVGLRGYGFKLLWYNSVWLQTQSTYIFSAFTGIFSILFFQHFIGKHNIPKAINLLIKFALAGYAAVFVLILFKQYQIGFIFLQVFAMLAIALSLSAGFVAVRKKIPAAKFYLIAWIAFIIGIILFILKDVGVIPYSALSVNALPLGAVIESLLLSFALANRIKLLQNEKDASQQQLLNDALLHKKQLNEQNKNLDNLVQIRTQKLQETLTDLKRSEVEMVNKEKMSSLGILTAGIAHEINNPINFVTSSIIPLKRDIKEVLDYLNLATAKPAVATPPLDPYVIEEINMLLNGIEEGANRTAVIIRGLQKFSRSDKNEMKPADVIDGLENTLMLLNTQMNGQVQVQKQYQQLPLISCNIGRLNQVFLNILTNAIHAVLDNGKPSKQISIDVQQIDNKLQIIFTDNGIGMSAETISKIFDPFYTTKDVGKGTGLGMSISLGIIEAHHGQIVVTSTLVEGSTITIILPIT